MKSGYINAYIILIADYKGTNLLYLHSKCNLLLFLLCGFLYIQIYKTDEKLPLVPCAR